MAGAAEAKTKERRDSYAANTNSNADAPTSNT
jgi:hypothetical protein